MEADWDLHAVVRSCSATAATATSTTTDCTSSHFSTSINTQQDWNNSFSVKGFQDLLSPRTEPTYTASELHDIYKPFYLNSRQEHKHEASKQRLTAVSPQSLPISPLSVLNGLTDLSAEQRQQKNQTQHIMFNQLPLQRQHLLSVSNGSKSSPRSSKKRKNNLKKVCHVPVEKLSSDMWSWRKYGQKPIKGSPYPRGYYKCSTSKGCPARKQVERNRSDPGMFIVTYASEHNHPMPTHRSSLAGTTRTKPSGEDSGKTTAVTSSLPEISSPVTSNSEKMESSQCHEDNELVEAEDDDLSVSDVPFDDDFFAGLEDLAGRECGSGGLVENLWPLED